MRVQVSSGEAARANWKKNIPKYPFTGHSHEKHHKAASQKNNWETVISQPVLYCLFPIFFLSFSSDHTWTFTISQKSKL